MSMTTRRAGFGIAAMVILAIMAVLAATTVFAQDSGPVWTADMTVGEYDAGTPDNTFGWLTSSQGATPSDP